MGRHSRRTLEHRLTAEHPHQFKPRPADLARMLHLLADELDHPRNGASPKMPWNDDPVVAVTIGYDGRGVRMIVITETETGK